MAILSSVKITISIPDELFEQADRLVRRTKKSRRQVFCEALQEYVARHTPEAVTEAMDRVCAEVAQGEDPFVSLAARRVLKRSEW